MTRHRTSVPAVTRFQKCRQKINEEGKKGQIRVGWLADLIVPDRDFFACAGDEIADTTSELTVGGGKVV